MNLWKRENPEFEVFTQAVVGINPRDIPGWIRSLGAGPIRKNKYYPKLTDRYSTPWGALLRAIVASRPESIVAYGFSGWTLFAVVLRKVGLLNRLVILLEGSTPGVDLKGDVVRTFFRKIMARTADEAFSQTPEGVRYLLTLGHQNPGIKIWMLPNLNEIKTKDTQPKKKQHLKLLMVASIEKRKGFDFIFDVLKQLAGSWELDIIGEEIEDPERKVETPNHPKIKIVGPLSHKETLAKLCEYDVFLFPSREDTWGMAPLEAACAGLTVIGSPHFGSHRLIPGAKILPLIAEAWKKELENLLLSPSTQKGNPIPNLPPISSL